MCNSRKQTLLLITFNFLFVLCVAQNDINSPYSGFGIGNISSRTNNVLSAMGGVGYALQNPYYINFKNPASFAAFDSLSFVGDLSFSIINQQLKTDNQNQSGTIAHLDYFAIGLPVLRIWRTSAGIMPFSDVGYGIIEQHKDTIFKTITNKYTGTGGLQLLYWGNAFKVYKGFTIGVNISYLFGTINSVNFAEYSTENSFNTMISNFRYLDGIYISGGIQYHATIKEKNHISIGVVYENSIKVWSRENLMILNYFDTYSPNLYFDTIDYKTGKNAEKSIVKLPQIIGGGIAYGYKDRLITSLDLTWQNWKQFRMSNSKDNLINNLVTAFGVQFTPNPTSSKYYNKINFRLGTRISTGYMLVEDKKISEIGVSFGLGFPIRTLNSRSSVNMMFEYSRLGTINNNLILQNYFKVSFNFILQERWYQRRKLE
ncbi:MAG: hypothetical protein LBU83_04745 [Bacteroidales bacterium]|jgi:hypothetical protein|nr:hypothetical protein [Bacteroidales bacterium]